MHAIPKPAGETPLSTLLEYLFSPDGTLGPFPVPDDYGALPELPFRTEGLDKLLNLADTNHVIVRFLQVVLKISQRTGDRHMADWAAARLESERAIIENKLSHLQSTCETLQSAGCSVTVIKSLDHWPDLGSDLDLYTGADPKELVRTMVQSLNAEIEPRSWGDKLAGKWNFRVPGLSVPVEIHVRRLGQTGEQVGLGHSVLIRSMTKTVGARSFRVPTHTDRLLISTLQRMYRHFYLRLCDVLDTAELLDANAVDFSDLQGSAEASGIWPGLATYLKIVSDYVRKYRGLGLHLPQAVLVAAQSGGERVREGGDFLRLPIVPQAAKLYGMQLADAIGKGDLPATFRLTLLPCLASAAAVRYKFTGDDKGIW